MRIRGFLYSIILYSNVWYMCRTYNSSYNITYIATQYGKALTRVHKIYLGLCQLKPGLIFNPTK